jgi:hypothetical protein
MAKLTYNFKGRGIDASKEPFLKAGDFTYFYKLPDNLYRIQHALEPGSYDYLFSRDLIFHTKYYWILLKEWFYMLKVGGLMAIEFIPEGKYTLDFLEEQARFLFRNKISVKSRISEDGAARLELIKIRQFEYEKHPLTEWTFGIITNGKADANVDKIIENIKRLDIPKFEIIICGTYNGLYKAGDPLIGYVHFTEKDELGWITKKKNIIAGKAIYENLAIIHDRVFFESDWLSAMKAWGPCFESMACRLRNVGDEVSVTWGTPTYYVDDPRRAYCYELDPGDWDEWVFVGGAATFIKKSVWKESKWDERRFWGHDEDMALSHDLTKEGYITRYNPWALLYVNRGQNYSYVKLRIAKRLKHRGEIVGPLYNKLRTGSYALFRQALASAYDQLGIKYRPKYSMDGYYAGLKKTGRIK